MIGVNPGYDAPADLEFAKHSAKGRLPSASGTLRRRNRRALDTGTCRRRMNSRHGRTCGPVDGTASIVQPLIRPLFRSWTDHELLALLMGHGDASPYDLVRETWQPQGGSRFRGMVDPRVA